jgi:carbon storage regulator CsrA
MLVLTRRVGERFVIFLGEQIVEVEILGQKSGACRVGITADRSVTVLRSELLEDTLSEDPARS